MSRFEKYIDRIRAELHSAFTEDHTPRETAGSFALGTFITMLPTLGTGLLLFVAIVYVADWVSKIALFASVLVFNPVVKWGVYIGSFTLGVVLLGPVDGVSTANVSISGGPEILVRLLLGNLILAVLATVVSYVIVYRLAVRYQQTDVAKIIDEAVEEIVEETLDD
jgi:uncharacterized protein (DUF2062 family)